MTSSPNLYASFYAEDLKTLEAEAGYEGATLTLLHPDVNLSRDMSAFDELKGSDKG